MKKQKIKNKKILFNRNKSIFISISCTLILLALVFKIIYINASESEDAEKYIRSVQMNRINNEQIPPLRGNIYDRDMKILASSHSTYNIVWDIIDFDKVSSKNKEKRDEIISGLSEVLGIPIDLLDEWSSKDAITGELIHNTRYFIIKREVSSKELLDLKEKNISTWYSEELQKRTYPHGSLATQVLGFMRTDDSYGIEYQYNKEMLGSYGRIFSTHSNKNEVNQNLIEAQDGYSVVSTIDLKIQGFAEEAVKKAVEEYNPENAIAIVMNPQTGEVLAMAQDSTFNPNDPSNFEYIYNSKLNRLNENGEPYEQLDILFNTWKNFNISDAFEPGSIFKPMVVAAALEEKVISGDETFYCPGYVEINGERISCWKADGHGHQNLTEALANSCNIAIIEIAEKLGYENFYKYQQDFGYGEETGIDLPFETHVAKNVYSLEQLKNLINLSTSAMGQGFVATPIQSINAFASVINGGKLIQPYVIARVIDSDENVIIENKPKIIRNVISQEVSDFLRTELRHVMVSGTGVKSNLMMYSVGGKTGTAQQGRRDDNIHTVSQISYLDIENPEIIVLVSIHKPEEYIDGVTTAADMMHGLMTDIINYKNIHPISEEIYDDFIELDNFIGTPFDEAVSKLNSMNIDFELINSGGDIIVSQSPSAGTRVEKGEYFKVYFKVEGSENFEKPVIVPDLKGANLVTAIEILERLNLDYFIVDSSIDIDETDDIELKEEVIFEERIVIEQMPKYNSKVPEGTQIRIKASN